ncbi:hypothetical protein PM082_011037 [Marasmius tenuissimus]|nr:hypothetical protein PM082_011037 [Marasmius tenuissimus]
MTQINASTSRGDVWTECEKVLKLGLAWSMGEVRLHGCSERYSASLLGNQYDVPIAEPELRATGQRRVRASYWSVSSGRCADRFTRGVREGELEGVWTRVGKSLETGEGIVRVSSSEGPKSYLNVNSLEDELGLGEEEGDSAVFEDVAVVGDSCPEDVEVELDDEDDDR